MKSHYCELVTKDDLGKEITLAGWVSTIRDLGGIIFVELRDKTGLFQVVADPQLNKEVHNVFQKLKTESVIQVKGKVSLRPDDTINESLVTGEIEMYPETVKVLSEAMTLPFVLDDENVSEES